jgi:hypothetical protein
MTAIMPRQENETSRSGSRSTATATGLRLVRAWPAIVVSARAMFFLLLANATTSISAWLAVLHIVATWIAAKRLISGNTVARRELDFQLDDFIPLLIGSIPLWNRKEFAQATTRIGRRGYDDGSFGRIFWIRIIHCNL